MKKYPRWKLLSTYCKYESIYSQDILIIQNHLDFYKKYVVPITWAIKQCFVVLIVRKNVNTATNTYSKYIELAFNTQYKFINLFR